MATEKKEAERGVGALDRSCIIIMYNVMCNSVEDASIIHYTCIIYTCVFMFYVTVN